MLIARLLLLTILIYSSTGCNKNKSVDVDNMTVKKYVDLLKEGKYKFRELPNFTYEDISDLLEYSKETQRITNFPVNMISSFAMPECSLGLYILWTIESIRARAINSEKLIGSFPSLNPIVQKREAPFDSEFDVSVQEIISIAYQNWWEANKDKDFDEFKQIDPLEETGYRWQ